MKKLTKKGSSVQQKSFSSKVDLKGKDEKLDFSANGKKRVYSKIRKKNLVKNTLGSILNIMEIK